MDRLDRQRTLIAIAAAAVFCGLCAAAYAQAPPAPVNDHYLQSLRLNDPGRQLERTDTLRDVRDTTSATVQGDLFNPPQSGGPGEPTQCQGVSYGKTVWYDFYPDVSGLARIRASGFDAVISVVPFNRSSAQPRLGSLLCSNASSSTTEEFLVRVAKGDAYSIQLGGVNNAGGSLEFLFDFLADTDADGVLDDVDRCKRLDGPESRSGCPIRLKGEATLRASPTAGGIELVGLSRVGHLGVARRGQLQPRLPQAGQAGRQRGVPGPAGAPAAGGLQAGRPREQAERDRRVHDLQDPGG